MIFRPGRSVTVDNEGSRRTSRRNVSAPVAWGRGVQEGTLFPPTMAILSIYAWSPGWHPGCMDRPASALPDAMHGARAAGSLLVDDLRAAEAELDSLRTRNFVGFVLRVDLLARTPRDGNRFPPPGGERPVPKAESKTARGNFPRSGSPCPTHPAKRRRGSVAGALHASDLKCVPVRPAEAGEQVHLCRSVVKHARHLLVAGAVEADSHASLRVRVGVIQRRAAPPLRWTRSSFVASARNSS